MGKVKSAIITALLLAAILILTLFATVSLPELPGSNGVDRYNSFISSIRLGSDFTGEAYAVLYPAGVISVADYNAVVRDEENADSKAEYEQKYERRGGVYVDKDKLTDEAAFKASVQSDAEILSDRFSEKGYTSYSVAVQDGFTIKVSVPTNFSYAAYKGYNSGAKSVDLTTLSHAVSYLTLSGSLDLRDGEDYKTSKTVIGINDNFESWFAHASLYGIGGTYAVHLELTDEGFEKFNQKLTGDTSTTLYIYVGENNCSLQFSGGTALEGKDLMFQLSRDYSQDYAILFDSVIRGNHLANIYSDETQSTAVTLISASPVFGDGAAIALGVTVLIIIVAAIVCSIIKYRLLGVVNSLMVLIFALTLITSALLLNIQITVAGALCAALGLALMCFTNFRVFEAVRKETKAGRTLNASVKVGYKKTLFGILDLHLILLGISLILTLVAGSGELFYCGFITFISVVASYVIYWFTRFMWYVMSSLARDKYAFCGYAREEEDDD